MGQLILLYVQCQKIIFSEKIFYKFIPFTLFSSVSPLAHNKAVFYDIEHTSCYEIDVIPISSNWR